MQSCELVASITAIACMISKTCTKKEITVLAAALTQLSDTLITILAQEEACEVNVVSEKDKTAEKDNAFKEEEASKRDKFFKENIIFKEDVE